MSIVLCDHQGNLIGALEGWQLTTLEPGEPDVLRFVSDSPNRYRMVAKSEFDEYVAQHKAQHKPVTMPQHKGISA